MSNSVATLHARLELLASGYTREIERVVQSHHKLGSSTKQVAAAQTVVSSSTRQANGRMVEAGRILEDLTSTSGNLQQQIRAVGNNFTQLAATVSGKATLLTAAGFAAATFAAKLLSAKNDVAKFNSEIERSALGESSPGKDRAEKMFAEWERLLKAPDDLGKKLSNQGLKELEERLSTITTTVKDAQTRIRTLATTTEKPFGLQRASEREWYTPDGIYVASRLRSARNMLLQDAGVQLEGAASWGERLTQLVDERQRLEALVNERLREQRAIQEAIGDAQRRQNEAVRQNEANRRGIRRMMQSQKKLVALERERDALQARMDRGSVQGSFGSTAERGTADVFQIARAQEADARESAAKNETRELANELKRIHETMRRVESSIAKATRDLDE